MEDDLELEEDGCLLELTEEEALASLASISLTLSCICLHSSCILKRKISALEQKNSVLT